MTYSINGVPLDNASHGWTLMRQGTAPFAGIVRNRTVVEVPGLDGYRPGPSTTGARTIVLRVRTPQESLEALLALVSAPGGVLTRTDLPGRVAAFELSSAIPSGNAPSDHTLLVTLTLIVPGAAWRANTPETTAAITITNPSQVVDVLAGLSAPVRDAEVFLSGVFGEFVLADSSGAWLKTTGAWAGTAGTGILFNGATGQAFKATTAAPWTPLDDVSEQIDVSGNGGFAITPHLVSGNPTDRIGRLTLTTLSQTSVTLRLRARSAFLIQ